MKKSTEKNICKTCHRMSYSFYDNIYREERVKAHIFTPVM
nr:MAG TPA: Cytochrome b [Bacteriophage sp.]